MSKFWQKKYISKYTGAEIDAAVAKAEATEGLPEVDSEDFRKYLRVTHEGVWAKSDVGLSLGMPTNVGDYDLFGLNFAPADGGTPAAFSTKLLSKYITSPESLDTKIQLCYNAS